MTNPVNLNLDSIERLKSLPGVGEILASVIIEKRKERTWTRKNLAELDRPGRASALLLPHICFETQELEGAVGGSITPKRKVSARKEPEARDEYPYNPWQDPSLAKPEPEHKEWEESNIGFGRRGYDEIRYVPSPARWGPEKRRSGEDISDMGRYREENSDMGRDREEKSGCGRHENWRGMSIETSEKKILNYKRRFERRASEQYLAEGRRMSGARPRDRRLGGEEEMDVRERVKHTLPAALAFSGEEKGVIWEVFIEDFFTFLDLQKVASEEAIYYYLRMALKGRAKERLQVLLKYGIREPFFLLEKLNERYATPDRATTARSTLWQMAQEPEQTDEEWANCVEKAVFEAFPDVPPDFLNEVIIDRFTSGLNEERVHQHATALKFESMSEAMAAVRKFRQSRKLITRTRAVRTVTFQEPNEIKEKNENPELTRLVKDLTQTIANQNRESQDRFKTIEKKLEETTERLSRLDMRQEASRTSGGAGEGNKGLRDRSASPSPSTGRSRSASPLRCYKCQGLGHIASVCPSKGISSGNGARG